MQHHLEGLLVSKIFLRVQSLFLMLEIFALDPGVKPLVRHFPFNLPLLSLNNEFSIVLASAAIFLLLRRTGVMPFFLPPASMLDLNSFASSEAAIP